MIKRRPSAYLLSFVLVHSSVGLAASINVGSGSQVSLGGASINLGCNDLQIQGQLDLAQSTLTQVNNLTNTGALNGGQAVLGVSGSWSNTATFTPGAGTVGLSDGCGSTNVNFLGNSNFNHLAITTASGKQVNFAAGTTQTIATNLTLTGQAGNLLVIRSTTPGSPAFLCLAPNGSQTIAYIDVQDNQVPATCQPLAPGGPEIYHSVDSGGNIGWFLNAVISTPPIPTLSTWAIAVLIVMLLAWGGRRLRAMPRAIG